MLHVSPSRAMRTLMSWLMYIRSHTNTAGICAASSFLSVQEKLRFPSGTATAKVIRMLHGGAALDEADEPHPHAVCTLPVVGEVSQHA